MYVISVLRVFNEKSAECCGQRYKYHGCEKYSYTVVLFIGDSLSRKYKAIYQLFVVVDLIN